MNLDVGSALFQSRRRARRNFTPSEHDEQVNLIQWAGYAILGYLALPMREAAA